MLRPFLKVSNGSKRFYSKKCKAQTEILSDMFGITKNNATLYAKANGLDKKDPDILIESIRISRMLGYADMEIFNNPRLLRTHPVELHQHSMVLEEGAFNNITPHVLSRARTYMGKSIKELKLVKLIKDVNVQKHFIGFINPLPKKFFVEEMDDNVSWKTVHYVILREFLKQKLNASEDDIVKLFRIHKMVINKSFRVIQENIKLAKELGFTDKKILKYGYILHNYPQYTKTILDDFSNLAGADMRESMRKFPKLFMTSPKNMIKIYGALKGHNISDETIQKNMNIFHLSPETVKFRLGELKKVPEFKILLDNPRILQLVVHQNRAKSRLSFLKQLQLRCTNYTLLGSNCEFDDHIKEGKDKNASRETLKFLSKIFKVNSSIIKKRWQLHPFNLQVPYLDMEKTFQHLKSLDFQTKDIYDCMHIILYPKEKIIKALGDIRNDKNINCDNLTPAQILNLILYFLEREHHFTGNGVWQKYETAPPDKVLE
ncbi:unnamed protein product [Brassicogethes aeneus]|uniref:Transcription termination factor 5, mitochondrial n=1 Tax=Brassicogethes aeneus TaxID=1431903 RepID=A0A9P0BAW5_BRAAE|nr:unnamed protein product [Brassicogethes aeneus]